METARASDLAVMDDPDLRLVETKGIGFDLEVPAATLIDSVQVSYIGYAIKQ